MPDHTLAQRIRAKYPGVYDDLADIELEEKVSAKFPGTYDDIPRTQATLTRERPAAGTPSALSAGHAPEIEAGLAGDQVSPFSRVLGQAGADAGRVSKNNLPAIGGGLAALATGGAALPVVAGAAALGGGAGRLAQQQMEQGAHVPTSADAKDAAITGAGEGALQLAGGALAKGAGKVGRVIYGKALNANPSLVKQFGKGSRDAMARAGIEEGIVPGTSNAASRAEAAAIRSGTEARQVLNASPGAQANARVKMPAVAKGLDSLRAEVANRPTANVANEVIDKFESNFLASHPEKKSLDALLTLKQGAQKDASTAYRAATNDRMAALNAESNEAIAKEAQRILEEFAPATKSLNQRTKYRIGLTRALEDEQARNHALTALISGAAGVGTGFTTGDPVKGVGAAATAMAMRDPRVLGSVGIALAKVGGEAAEQTWANIFRAIRAAAEEQDETTDLTEPVDIDPGPVSVLPPLRPSTPTYAKTPPLRRP